MSNQSRFQTGTSGNDILRSFSRGRPFGRGAVQVGNGGSDRIIGTEGDDVLISGDAATQSPVPPAPTTPPVPPVPPAVPTPIALNGTPGNDTLTGTNQSEIFTGGAGADTLSGGEGDDTFVWNPGDGTDIVQGGSGKDTSIVNGAAESEIFTLSNVDGKAVFDRLSQAPFKITHDQVGQVQVNAGVGNDVLALENLDGSGLLTASFDGGDGNDVLFGGTSAIDIPAVGGAGDDILIGGGGNNALNGGMGNDALVGGAKVNQFMFTSGKSFNTADLGVDAISGFDSAKDQILLSKATFDAIGAGTGTSIGADFARVDSDEAAALSTAKIAYVQPSGSSVGKLVYNQNGAEAGLGAGAQIASISGAPTLSEQNFVLVA